MPIAPNRRNIKSSNAGAASPFRQIAGRRAKMQTVEYTRSTGKRLTYKIAYDQGEYFITREGNLKKSVPDAFSAGIVFEEARPPLMLRCAIADIEALLGMDE
jgi:hypothetical protein